MCLLLTALVQSRVSKGQNSAAAGLSRKRFLCLGEKGWSFRRRLGNEARLLVPVSWYWRGPWSPGERGQIAGEAGAQPAREEGKGRSVGSTLTPQRLPSPRNGSRQSTGRQHPRMHFPQGQRPDAVFWPPHGYLVRGLVRTTACRGGVETQGLCLLHSCAPARTHRQPHLQPKHGAAGTGIRGSTGAWPRGSHRGRCSLHRILAASCTPWARRVAWLPASPHACSQLQVSWSKTHLRTLLLMWFTKLHGHDVSQRIGARHHGWEQTHERYFADQSISDPRSQVGKDVGDIFCFLLLPLGDPGVCRPAWNT